MVIDLQRKASFIKHSVPFTVAISLIFPVSGGLRAQEIKKTAPEVNPKTVYSNQSGFSRDSSLLKTSSASVQNPQPTAIVAPSNPPSSLDINPTNSKKYSLTKLDVDRLSVKTLGTVNKNQFAIAQQAPTQELAPSPTSQEPLAQSNQTPEDNKDKEKSPSRSTSSDSSNPEFPVRLYLGPDFFYRNYSEEEITPGFKSHEFGTLYGLQANLDYVKSNAVYFGLGLRYGGGKTTYDGGTQSGDPFKSKTDNQFFNLEGRLGYTFQTGRKKNPFLISPFVAAGYHQWNRDIAGGSVQIPNGQTIPIFDTKEVYSWSYVGPGFHAEYKISPKFTIGLNAKLMFMLGTDFDVKTSFGGTVTDQGKGNLGKDFQYEIELPLTYTIVQNSKNAIDLKLTPYYRSQDIARGPNFETTSGCCSREPASTTSVYGATFGVQFRF